MIFNSCCQFHPFWIGDFSFGRQDLAKTFENKREGRQGDCHNACRNENRSNQHSTFHLVKHLLDGEKYFRNEQVLHHLPRTKCFLVASHHVDEDLVDEQDDTHKARNPFQSTLSDRRILVRPQISPGDYDAEKKGGDQLDLVAELGNDEDKAGEDGALGGLREDGDEDQGRHDAAGQVAA